ncbi:MAG: hypothetical protein COU47_00595 [Candidatus Niyogibacteria bacterium CG10_big_fil_rev_8_21_14_0_10_46_36]|uniref:Cytidyltransferase-like domain-containing protein n=1 Tax=Candidatus Niyogibacteria bacterium CG10_big_fil_rev_8_21_14_0_10_46_36 TaxID=1974726 RepID=A0A2H0TEN7_9BACT|nr:MAG: hypothetical protein COU47_00595 [Candidatus Niyogibacteria bacterium CG10_big_fil_rev_8_21_14_0_10_46_36]
MRKSVSPIIVAVSGGFDPIHIGHIRLFKEAKTLGDRLIVVLNNDHWLRAKKGYVFMPERERKEIIEALSFVDKVVVTGHPKNPKDMSVTDALMRIRPHIFANGGDVTQKNAREKEVCKIIKCKMAFNTGKGGKIQSSSSLVKRYQRSL